MTSDFEYELDICNVGIMFTAQYELQKRKRILELYDTVEPLETDTTRDKPKCPSYRGNFFKISMQFFT